LQFQGLKTLRIAVDALLKWRVATSLNSKLKKTPKRTKLLLQNWFLFI
jgi:hypothetical protein